MDNQKIREIEMARHQDFYALPFGDFAKISVGIPVSWKVVQGSWMRISLRLMCYVNVPELNLKWTECTAEVRKN